jgi:glycerol-3-phosphate dehydrogenase
MNSTKTNSYAQKMQPKEFDLVILGGGIGGQIHRGSGNRTGPCLS